MKYQVTFRNHLRALELFLITIVGIIVFAWYQIIQNNFDNSLRDGLIVFALISLLPVLYLHIEYYSYSRCTALEMDFWTKKIIYTDKTGVAETYGFDDLSKIIIYMSPHWHSKRMFLRIPFDTYHYARVYTKSGKEIILTSLLVSNVKDALGNIRGVPIELKKRIFASVLIR